MSFPDATVEPEHTNTVIRSPESPEEFADYFRLRWRELREPLGMPIGSEQDEHEQGAIHRGAYRGGVLVGVGRVHCVDSCEAQVRYLAVTEECHGQGIGSTILDSLEEAARLRGAEIAFLNSRQDTISFYLEHGYAACGSEVKLHGITHLPMRKLLP